MLPRPDPRARTPVSEQIASAIRAKVASGEICEGSGMESVRALASQLLVNPNTVAKVYRELEREKLLCAKPGSGVKVTPGAAARARKIVLRDLKKKLTSWFEEARDAGLDEELMRELLTLELQKS